MTDTTKRKRTKWIWIGGVALLVVTLVGAAVVPRSRGPLAEEFIGLADRYGLELYDESTGGLYIDFDHPLAEQQQLVKEFEALVTRHGMDTYSEFDNSTYLIETTQTPSEPRYMRKVVRGSRSTTVSVELSCTGSKTTLEIDVDRKSLGEIIREQNRTPIH